MITKKIVAIVNPAGLLATGVGPAAPADADSDRCPLSFSFMRKLLPIAPDLDQDVDPTREFGTIEGHPGPQPTTGQPADAPPADPRVGGCV